MNRAVSCREKTAMITVTDLAAKELAALLKTKDAPEGSGLRLGVERGGCAGLAYTMRIGEAKEGDQIIELGGTRFIVAADSFDFLEGCTVDFTEALSDRGFKIFNPNAARSCGCGTSFEPTEEGKKPEYDPALDGTQCK
ncbi:iron-sulfur cluster assembly accessory protein [Akkermansiaceae bacterium]|nr:iron-sulfur cluster assembly accessory protein [Akkermansiaceae bacterium]MDB4266362.1 iron-sulfur cluster assembly accessory protein [bacterium]MDA7518662.1 iron-sulfur cluster assembly accessory protein [Akkermansiaceae bacterium]MDA7537936.1 iron-sulfur cluster assembly accessory protein [Akkermansiaceae bacterium]MDA7538319.1 iron-sulfur cluster assembly accessory protein [Akkermansiaceae bacterium]